MNIKNTHSLLSEAEVNFKQFQVRFGYAQQTKAFTLVELIVVIVILAILGTIAFISLQGYAADARNTKRISDVKSLLTKIEIEHIKGVPYSQLINSGNGQNFDSTTGIGCHTGTIHGESVNICQGPAIFPTLKENRSSFLDPTTKQDYIFAYTDPVLIDLGNGRTESREFIQGLSVKEDNNNVLVGNYYRDDEQDEKGLILGEDGKPLVNNENSGIVGLACGTAHGTMAYTKPETNLCLGGTPLKNPMDGTIYMVSTSDSPYIWMCIGNDGQTSITCNTNRGCSSGVGAGFYCSSTGTYVLCENGIPDMSETLSCESGYFCNNLCSSPCINNIPDC